MTAVEFKILANKHDLPPNVYIKTRVDGVHIVRFNAAMFKLLNINNYKMFNLYVSEDNSVIKVEPSKNGNRKFTIKNYDCKFSISNKEFNKVDSDQPITFHVQDGSLLIEWPNTKGA